MLLIAFGSLLAMGLPVLTAVLGIGAGLSLIALLGHIFPAPSFSPIVAWMIGLGVGVDYALFIVTRFREALRERPGPARRPRSSRCAPPGGPWSSRARTVVIGMLGLFVLRQPLLNGVAVAAAATVAMVLLGSLTLLPALLGFTGTRLARPVRCIRLPPVAGRPPPSRPPSLPAAAGGAPGRRAVGRADPAAAADRRRALRRLLLLAAPALGMKLSIPDESARRGGPWGTPATPPWPAASGLASTRR